MLSRFPASSIHERIYSAGTASLFKLGLVAYLRVQGQKVVAPSRLHAVAGVVEQSDGSSLPLASRRPNALIDRFIASRSASMTRGTRPRTSSAPVRPGRAPWIRRSRSDHGIHHCSKPHQARLRSGSPPRRGRPPRLPPSMSVQPPDSPPEPARRRRSTLRSRSVPGPEAERTGESTLFASAKGADSGESPTTNAAAARVAPAAGSRDDVLIAWSSGG